MVQVLLVGLVLSGADAGVEVQRRSAGALGDVERLLALPSLSWGMPLVEFKEKARAVNTVDALAPCRPDGEVCRLTLVREYVERDPAELPSIRARFEEKPRDDWAAVGALRLAPVAELVFDRETARLSEVKVMQFVELIAAGDGLTFAELTPGTWSLTPRAAGRATEGTVRFVAFPWADVSCGKRVLGQTPFAEQRFAPGSYTCVFSNSDLGVTRTVNVDVRANERTKVLVRFE